MNINDIKNHKDLVSMHRNICRKCGICCHIRPFISIQNMRFIPTAEKLEDISKNDKTFLGLQVCEFLDVNTKECTIYDNRPVECRNFHCKGKPRPQTVTIQGSGIGIKN